VNDNVEQDGQPKPDFLVVHGRPVGTDIGWTTSPDFWDVVLDAAGRIAVKAALAYIGA
jgi:hypothetical protein